MAEVGKAVQKKSEPSQASKKSKHPRELIVKAEDVLEENTRDAWARLYQHLAKQREKELEREAKEIDFS